MKDSSQEIIKSYNTLTEIDQPYQYQIKVAELLLKGKNVILTVPTGAGKTWASTIPFLMAKQKPTNNFPQKMIYSLPLRTLANSIYGDINSALGKIKNQNNSVSIHTGEYKNDEHFESDIVFSTIDQTLSNFLNFPLSLSKRQANINAGALIGSYLVFDEFHLLDHKLSMATTIGSLITLDNLCRFCIMTATLSNDYIKNLKKALDPQKRNNIEIVTLDDFQEDISKIKSLKLPKNKSEKKTVYVDDNKIASETILKHHGNKTIVICNRVEKAQKLYNDILATDFSGLENLKGLSKTNIICLHSRFFDSDRKSKEKKLKELFGKKNSESVILISTQVIEAGMDISCDVMHVEISPINSFLQRIGRCARWENQYGKIFVYDIIDSEEHEQLKLETKDPEELRQIKLINNKYLPYDPDICKTTFKKLKQIERFDNRTPQKLVNEILGSKETKDFDLMKTKDFNRKEIQESWESCNKNMYSRTIRDIQSIEVAIIDYEKERISEFAPYKFETIALYKWSTIGWMKKKFEEREDGDDYFAFKAIDQITDFDSFYFDETGYRLNPLRNENEIKQCHEVIFVDKSVFRYTGGAGLEIGIGNVCSPIKPFIEKEDRTKKYKKDTFHQHNMAMINCYEEVFGKNMEFVFTELNEYWDDEINWDKLIKAMICLHDYGKLNSEWQKKIKFLQKLIDEKNGRKHDPNEVLAHSDFNEETDKEFEKLKGMKGKPAHAGIGAFTALIILGDEFKDERRIKNILFPIVTAVIKHHSTETNSFKAFKIEQNEFEAFKTIWNNEVNIPFKEQPRLLKMNQVPLDKYLINSRADNIGVITYLLFVRILRLCDQNATKSFETYLNK